MRVLQKAPACKTIREPQPNLKPRKKQARPGRQALNLDEIWLSVASGGDLAKWPGGPHDGKAAHIAGGLDPPSIAYLNAL